MTLRINGATSGYTEITAPAVAGNNTVTLPSGNGSANQLLKNGATPGALAWSSVIEDGSGTLLSPNGAAFFGTVSDSGNGAIMERGSNANGDFVRFADGTMQCWSPSITTVVNVTTAAAGGFRGTMGTWTYPAAFSAAPSVHAQTRTNGHLTGALQTLSETSVGPNAWCATSTSSLTTIYQATAIGRWY
jgi:hypothetical protein